MINHAKFAPLRLTKMKGSGMQVENPTCLGNLAGNLMTHDLRGVVGQRVSKAVKVTSGSIALGLKHVDSVFTAACFRSPPGQTGNLQTTQ